MGLSIAAASRYVTICNLFWINNFVLLFTLLRSDFKFSNTQKKAVKSLIIILGLAVFVSHIVGTLAVVKHYNDMTEVKNTLLQNKSDSGSRDLPAGPGECGAPNRGGWALRRGLGPWPPILPGANGIIAP